jgi:hypothetical protein
MSIKLKALGLALFASLAIGAVSVVSATGATGGHFTSSTNWTTLSGSEIGGTASNYLEGTSEGPLITCPENKTTYTANVSATTVTQITVAPTYPNPCQIADSSVGIGPASIDMNGCDFMLTVETSAPAHTVLHLVCPAGTEVKVTFDPPVFGSCTIDYPSQTPTSGGVVYTATEHSGKASLRLDITAEGITSNETPSGFLGCGAQAGHNDNSDFFGTVTVTGKNTNDEAVDIKATGP